MAIVVTPGDANADSYTSVADAKAHWDKTGFAYADYTDAQIEQALVRSTAWIDGRYRRRFSGERTNGRAQALEWPRKNVKDIDGNEVANDAIPREVVAATAEAARREVAGVSLSPDLTLADTVKSERVAEIETEYAAAPSADALRPMILAVEEILGALFPVGGSTKFVMRA